MGAVVELSQAGNGRGWRLSTTVVGFGRVERGFLEASRSDRRGGELSEPLSDGPVGVVGQAGVARRGGPEGAAASGERWEGVDPVERSGELGSVAVVACETQLDTSRVGTDTGGDVEHRQP